MIQTQESGEKPHFGPNLGSLGPNSGPQFFFKNLPLSVTRYHGQLPSCRISEKTNDPILRKFSDRQTGRQADRQAGRQAGRQTDGRTDGRTRVFS